MNDRASPMECESEGGTLRHCRGAAQVRRRIHGTVPRRCCGQRNGLLFQEGRFAVDFAANESKKDREGVDEQRQLACWWRDAGAEGRTAETIFSLFSRWYSISRNHARPVLKITYY
jgi:hypothetical protein